MLAGMIVVMIIIFCVMFYIGFIYPILSLIHCAKNEFLTPNQRAKWMVAIFFIWPLCSYIYAAKYKSGVSMWRIAGSMVLFVFCIFGIAFYGISRARTSMGAAMLMPLTPDMVAELHPDDAKQFKEAIDTLRVDLQDSSIFPNDFQKNNSYLAHLYMIYGNDQSVDTKEFKDWIDIYMNRNQIDPDRLGEHVQRVKLDESAKVVDKAKEIDQQIQEEIKNAEGAGENPASPDAAAPTPESTENAAAGNPEAANSPAEINDRVPAENMNAEAPVEANPAQ